MFIFEILVLVVVFTFIANGMRAGAIETLGRLFGSIFGFLAAKYYSAWAIGILGLFMPSNWAYLVAFTLIFLAVDFAIGWLLNQGALAEGGLSFVTSLRTMKALNALFQFLLAFLL